MSKESFEEQKVVKNGKEKNIKMRLIGDMWGSGLFKHNACDFCDDVTTELADISLGDAWLNPYIQDGKGTNVVVTRSELATQIILDGIESKELDVTLLPLIRFLASQQGSFNHRHQGLGYRMRVNQSKGLLTPPKRHDQDKISIDFKIVQKKRQKIRALSLRTWKEVRNARAFDIAMSKSLKKLKIATTLNHYIRGIKRRLKIAR